MRKGSDIIGLKVISKDLSADEKANLGTVKDLIFEHETNELLALLISEKELFGLIDAQVVPWNQVVSVGADAVIVQSAASKIAAHEDPRIKDIMDRQTVLSGTKIYTTDGRDLGTFADLYVDEQTGQVTGYEVSGGFVSDTMSGKHFMAATEEISISKDVALVPPGVAESLDAQKEQQPGGLRGATATASEKVSDAYANIATASIDKQKEFVVGKTASHDVVIPASTTASVPVTPVATDATVVTPGSTIPAGSEVESAVVSDGTFATTSPADSTAIVPVEETGASQWSEPAATVTGEVLVHQGETITSAHADRAEAAGILHQLVLAATGGAASAAYASGAQTVSGVGASAQERAREAALGKPAGRDVLAPDGTVLVAAGMTITQEVLAHARAVGKENEVIAAAGVGAASQGVDSVKQGASNLWDTIKHKAAELTGAAHEKKAEYDAQAEQAKIKNALGRPTTRVILDPSDQVILNAGDLITNAAVEQARAGGVLDILLDSVYVADPNITPEMLRVKEHGQAALEGQVDAPPGVEAAPVQPAQIQQAAEPTSANEANGTDHPPIALPAAGQSGQSS